MEAVEASDKRGNEWVNFASKVSESGLGHSDRLSVAHGGFYVLFFSAYLALDPLDLRRYQGAGVPPPVAL